MNTLNQIFKNDGAQKKKYLLVITFIQNFLSQKKDQLNALNYLQVSYCFFRRRKN
jgi:hypothetical protein